MKTKTRTKLPWGMNLEDDVRNQVLDLFDAVGALNADRAPDPKVVWPSVAVALEVDIVHTKRDVLLLGRDQFWMWDVVFDNPTVDAALSCPVTEGARAVSATMLAAGFNPFARTGFGQLYANSKGLLLCEFRRRGQEVMRFFTDNEEVAAEHFMEPVGDNLRASFERAHRLTRQAIEVIPALAPAANQILVNKVRAGIAALPEAPMEIRPVRSA